MSTVKVTPMMEQFLRVKGEYPDTLVFFRMGDFFELFFEDAQIAARELQITLTSRNPGAENPVPMCGMPHHAIDEYLRQLLDKGYKVALCDQVEDPKQAKGLVKREVTRVLTPGTLVEDISLDAKGHNFLGALFWDADLGGGLAWVDFSTGAWSGMQTKNEAALWQWLVKMNPRELLLTETQALPKGLEQWQSRLSRYPQKSYFDGRGSGDKILRAQGVPNLQTLDLDDKPALTRCCGALLTYLELTQKRDLTHLAPFVPLDLSATLLLDEVTERNLELFRTMDGGKGRGTLWQVLDQTQTPMGGRLLETRMHQPFKDLGSIQPVQELVAYLHDRDTVREDLRRALDTVYDLERLCTRIVVNRSTPKDFGALKVSLGVLPRLRQSLLALESAPPKLTDLLRLWDDLDDVHGLLARALADSLPPVITEGGLFRPGYDPELDELMELTDHGEAALTAMLERERAACDLPKLKIGYTKVFGYYFELSKAVALEPPAHFIRRQTLVNAERYITEELKILEDKLLSASDRRKTREYQLFLTLREEVAGHRARFMGMGKILAELDFTQGLAHAARKWEWNRPELHDGLDIAIKGGRHPVVEAVQGRSNYIPNDLTLDDSGRVLLITGPNMAGKSTVLRQVALICILAQMGSFVPAASARLGLCDRIFSRVGASDNLAMGQSTFMVEMTETARILRQAGKRSLVILDEIGRGTSTFDGLSLAWAVAEELARRQGGIRTLFATHYHELTVLEERLPGVRNYNIAIKEWKGDIVFLRRMVPGPADRSYGIEVARLAGVPASVVVRAKEVLEVLERHAPGGGRRSDMITRQVALPGLGRTPAPQKQPAEHKVLSALKKLNVNELSPLDALTLLHQWKAMAGSS
ncbi:MAG: DNA mismatch repair protein MutS [Desulfomicrobium sp.]|nr:DNA mismatch repair protein MutS [Pseudomonadota bacterium]MBV1713371.1 DNA mismatch repair protein MutS [Desulfomicrobium sp.]MBU4570495.1 DNA mismatch repair protein MutS [Pseudomonadota bacterium]MBU4593852.1 DNA mismatch repair protein MutS [Pseudomonadota bacterium]MBV1719694.1 DNA mismatch repair protein MutS [Desulfomicrobium sp.]